MGRPITRLRVPCTACGAAIGAYCVSRKGTPIVQVHYARKAAAVALPPVTVHLTTLAGDALMLTERRKNEVIAHPKRSIRQQTIPIEGLTEESRALIERLPVGWTAKAAREVARA